jgi:uncharacterized membrane protein YfcA
VHGPDYTFPADWGPLLVFALIGAAASAINSVAGGGSLITFPVLTIGYQIDLKVANATNSVGLWPGSLSGAVGFWNLLPKTAHYLKTLWAPTTIGSIAGAWLLVSTSKALFESVVPLLLLFAALLLAFQPHVKSWAQRRQARVSHSWAILLQFLVSVYGGYFGAGMGIMMLAVFTLYMEGNIHEINAVKAWLGLIINFVASILFVFKGIVLLCPALALTMGSLIGGYYAAKYSQGVDPEKLRISIAAYGLLTAAYFAYRSWFVG